MDYKYTKITIAILILISCIYFFYRYTRTEKVKYYERKATSLFKQHQILIWAIGILLVLAFLAYKIETDYNKNKNFLNEYKPLEDIFKKLIKDKNSEPSLSPEQQVLLTNLRRWSMLNFKELSYAIEKRNWDDAEYLFNILILEKRPKLMKLIFKSGKDFVPIAFGKNPPAAGLFGLLSSEKDRF